MIAGIPSREMTQKLEDLADELVREGVTYRAAEIEFSRAMVRANLRAANGNKTHAARRAMLPLNTFRYIAKVANRKGVAS